MQQALGWALIRLFILSPPPPEEKKDKFLHQALTGTDKKNYRNQCRCYCFLSQLFHYLAARPWNISSVHVARPSGLPSGGLGLSSVEHCRWGALLDGWHRQKSQLKSFPLKSLLGNV